ncbi:MAG TPA: ATP-binding protein [Vicinamibacteria bacterium]|nr:ATP-binding protein [Vicinamibacteria bacterium]
MTRPLLTIALRSERDVVLARQRARQVARLLGFPPQDQTRLAIAVSEIARNAIQHATQGVLEFRLETDSTPQQLTARVTDQGPGFVSDANGLPLLPHAGTGLASARRLVDRIDVDTGVGRGTTVWLRKRLPRARPPLLASELPGLAEALARQHVDDFAQEIHQQNRELVQALDELRGRHEDLERLNRELEDTNRGVVALYAELDEKAEHLKRSDAMKSRFLSNMSHEFRTPLNAILAIGRLLQEHADGDLEPEQDKQVAFIMKAAGELTELVDDLLDLAKVEAGKIVVRRARLELAHVFGALRGMMRPLLVSDRVGLVIEEPVGLPPLESDEAKVGQVLRNLLSNALKFTESGEVRMRAVLSEDGRSVAISVSDTGIGIDAADQARIFEEFGQVEHAVQRRVKGTGLGLALSRRLAELLGGSLAVASTPGEGSVFTLTLPVRPADPEEPALSPPPGATVLMIDDDPASRYVVRGLVAPLGVVFHEAADGAAGLERVRERPPWAVVLDLVMPGLSGTEVLRRLRADAAAASLPVVIATSKALEPEQAQELAALRAVLMPKSELALPDAGPRLFRALARAASALASADAVADLQGKQG